MLKTLATAWGAMAYLESAGDSAPPLLYLHGSGCQAAEWSPVIAALQETPRSIAPDFRGHGRSANPTEPFTLSSLAEDVLHLTDRLGLHEFTIVGHSLGGMVGMAVAERSAGVTGLILLEGWTRLSAAGSAFDEGRFYGSLPESAIVQIQQQAAETRTRFQPNIWQNFGESVKDFDGYAYLKRAAIPIYAVFGAMGRNTLTEQRLRIPSNPNIHWVWIANAGHYLPHECPAEVAKVIATYLRT